MTANQKGILPKLSIDRPKIGSFLEDKKPLNVLAIHQNKQGNILFDIFIALNLTVLTIDLTES